MESQIAVDLPGRASPVATGVPQLDWNFATRVAFRFIFVYFALYNLTDLLKYLPFISAPLSWYLSMWKQLVPWVGSHVLRLRHPIMVVTSGSGDTIYDYVTVLCYLCLSIAACVVWSWIDRRRRCYPRLLWWLRLSLRIALGGSLIGYGLMKVIKAQFPDPSLARMLQPYGDSSPMGLLWTMMGASKSYNMFAGCVEVAGGLLLFIPCLTTLGALLCIVIMSNVFMLNLSYDVPVKLYSFHLLAMATLLVVPDLRRMIDFFIFHRTSRLPADLPVFRRKWIYRATLACLLLLCADSIYESLGAACKSYKDHIASAEKPLLRGIWMTDEFSMDGVLRPFTFEDRARWYRIIFDPNSETSFQAFDGTRQPYRTEIDESTKTVTFFRHEDPGLVLAFKFDQPNPQTLVLAGELEGKKVMARLHHVEPPEFPLKNRGFHWISEYPYNH